jgi:hypothetical protein
MLAGMHQAIVERIKFFPGGGMLFIKSTDCPDERGNLHEVGTGTNDEVKINHASSNKNNDGPDTLRYRD